MLILLSRYTHFLVDLAPNSHNQLARKCVAAREENEQSDLGNLRLNSACHFLCFYQVDYLQQANHDLEKQLKDTVDQKVEATRRANELEATNADLLLELKDLNRLSRQVEHDKERDVIAIQSELSDTKVSLAIFKFLNLPQLILFYW